MKAAIVFILCAAVVSAGCGQPSSERPAAAPPSATVHDGRAVSLTADNTIKFSVKEITAAPGERISLTLTNTGTMAKFSMGHNFVLLDAGTEMTPFLTASAEAPTTDYVPAKFKAQILAATKLLGPNEKDTVTFSAPTTPGRYEFVCSFPGHYQVGMRGVLIVG